MAVVFETKGTNEDDYRFSQCAVVLSRLELIAVNKFLIVSCAFSKIVGFGHLHFNIERAIGAFFLNINVEADAFAVGTEIDSLFTFGIIDFTDFNVKSQKLHALIGKRKEGQKLHA